MKHIRYIGLFLLGSVFFAGVALAIPYYSQERSLIPADSTENIGTSTSRWAEGWFADINISGTCTGCGGLTSYDAWTHPLTGWSATTTILRSAGFVSTASSTFQSTLNLPSLTDGGLAVYGGVVGSYASTTFSTGLTYVGGAVTCDTASASVFGCLASADWSAFNSKTSFGESWKLYTNIFSQSSLTPTTTQNIHVNGIGTSTFSGGLEAWRQIAAPYFHATSSTATSTYNGSVHIKNNLQVDGNAAFTVNLQASSLTSALLLTDGSGNVAEYAGSATCTNQGVTVISALGAVTCSSINNAWWSGTDLSVANGGTGLSAFGGTNTILYTTAADAISSETALTYDPATNRLTADYASSTAKSAANIMATTNLSVGTTTVPTLFSVGNALTNGGLYFNTTGFAIGSSSPQFRFSVTPNLSNLASTFYINSAGKIVGYDSVNAWPGAITPTRRPGFSIATSTATWTATSTPGRDVSPEKPMDYGGTIRSVSCKFNTFLGVRIYINATPITPTYFVGSSTQGTITVTGTNTFVKGDYIWADVGTTTSATAASGVVRGSCVLNNTED